MREITRSAHEDICGKWTIDYLHKKDGVSNCKGKESTRFFQAVGDAAVVLLMEQRRRNIVIKGIVFDFDGLILDTETIWYHSFREAFEQHQLDLPLQTFASFVGTHGGSFNTYLKKVAGTKEKLETIRRVANDLHREKIKEVEARAGVGDYLATAKELGLRIGLASSSNRAWVEGFLRQLQLLPYFEVIKTADDVERVKPDPELYVKAVSALHLSPDEVLAFEDSAAGAKAAKAAGLKCVIVPNPVTMDLLFESYDWRIESMAHYPLTHVLAKLDRKWSEDFRGPL